MLKASHAPRVRARIDDHANRTRITHLVTLGWHFVYTFHRAFCLDNVRVRDELIHQSTILIAHDPHRKRMHLTTT